MTWWLGNSYQNYTNFIISLAQSLHIHACSACHERPIVSRDSIIQELLLLIQGSLYSVMIYKLLLKTDEVKPGCHKKIFGRRTYKHDLIRKLCIGRLFKHAQRRAQIGRPHMPDGVLWCPGWNIVYAEGLQSARASADAGIINNVYVFETGNTRFNPFSAETWIFQSNSLYHYCWCPGCL